MATFPTPESRHTPPPNAARMLLAEELLEIAERAQTHSSANGVIIALRRNNELVVRTSNGIAPEVGACIPLPSGVTGLCVTTKKPQTSASADAEAQLETVFRALSVRSVLSVPVQWDGEVRGVLAVLSQAPEAFNRTHIAILMTLRDVIAHKLSLCELPSDSPAQLAAAAGQPVKISAESLLKAPAPQPAVVVPKPPAPAPRKITAVAAQPVAPVVPRRVEPTLPTLPVIAEPKPPVATPPPAKPVAQPLAELITKPVETRATTNPDVLSPSEDPTKYGSVQKLKPVVRPAVRTTPIAVASSPAIFTAYHAPTKSGGKNILGFGAAAAVLVVLGFGIAFYASHRSAPAAPAETARVATEETPAPAPAPALVAVPLPKSAEEHPPVTAESRTEASSTTPARRAEGKRTADSIVSKREEAKRPAVEPKRAAEESKRKAEETVRESAPVLHVAAAKSAAESDEQIEPPAPALIASSNAALPDLGTVSAAGATLAVRKSAAVPATLIRGKAPQYPEAARRLGLSGVVKLQISVSAEGKVTDVRALTGDALLRQASVAAVREWVYRPAYLNGNPVPSTAEVSLQFKPSK